MFGFLFFRKSLDINGQAEGVRRYKEKTREGAQPCNEQLRTAGTNWHFPWRQMKCGGDNGAWAGSSCPEVIPALRPKLAESTARRGCSACSARGGQKPKFGMSVQVHRACAHHQGTWWQAHGPREEQQGSSGVAKPW